jgi:ankyrin repeat protein
MVENHGTINFDSPVRYRQNLVFPLELALRKLSSSMQPVYREISTFMLERGADPGLVLTRHNNVEGQTLLHLVASWLNAEAVSVLLEYGADPNILDKHRRSPLHVACMSLQGWSFLSQKCDDICEALVDAGADPEREDAYGYTPQDYMHQHIVIDWGTGMPMLPTFAIDLVWNQDGDRTRCPSEASDSCSEASDSDCER